MTREEITQRVNNLISTLSESDLMIAYIYTEQMQHEDLKELLRRQPMPCDRSLEEIRDYIRAENRGGKMDEFMMIADIFEYGRIYGIRQERARRKHRRREEVSKGGERE